MFSEERIALYKQSLDEALRRYEEIVIFEDPASGKFVQFAVQAGDGEVIVDIPPHGTNDRYTRKPNLTAKDHQSRSHPIRSRVHRMGIHKNNCFKRGYLLLVYVCGGVLGARTRQSSPRDSE